MRVGIFARTFDEPSLENVLDAVAKHQIYSVHFNLRCAGVQTLPKTIDDALCTYVRDAFEQRGLEMIAISGTYNMVHPKLSLRKRMTRRACQLVERASDLGTSLVSLCTGTGDPHNMWQAHSDNDSAEAWRDLIGELECLLPVAVAHGVTLGIEPEKGNVINSAAKARRLLDEMKSKHLKIVMDGANLFNPNEERPQREVLAQAFDLLGDDIAIVHAKDITDDPTKNHQAAGTGRLDWKTYFQCIAASGYDGPIVLHNLAPSQVEASVHFIKRQAHQWLPLFK